MHELWTVTSATLGLARLARCPDEQAHDQLFPRKWFVHKLNASYYIHILFHAHSFASISILALDDYMVSHK